MATRQLSAIGLAALGVLLVYATAVPSADTKSSKRGGTAKSAPATEAGDSTSDSSSAPTEIVIRRRRIHLRVPEKYQVPMHLDPVRTVRLAAPFDGTVKSILHKPGEHLESAAEVIRMDMTEKELRRDRAKALYQVAKLEVEQASGNAKLLADARLQAAKAELDLAVYWVEQGALRAPFSCEVLRVDVSDGQIVRMGEPLAIVGDMTALMVEMPVDRNTTKAGQPMEIKVEDRTVPATVDAILPLASRFEALRDLVPSAASAILIVPNTDGRLRAGQTVYSPFVPRDVVADVPNSCITNSPDGNHKVQVLRSNVVRDVPIATLAAVGPDRSFISGAFDPSDEVIESATPELADGTIVRPSPPSLQSQEVARPNSTPTSRSRPQSTETPAAEPPSRPSGI
jgi:membrane fusion protein, multidrug efflux system